MTEISVHSGVCRIADAIWLFMRLESKERQNLRSWQGCVHEIVLKMIWNDTCSPYSSSLCVENEHKGDVKSRSLQPNVAVVGRVWTKAPSEAGNISGRSFSSHLIHVTFQKLLTNTKYQAVKLQGHLYDSKFRYFYFILKGFVCSSLLCFWLIPFYF